MFTPCLKLFLIVCGIYCCKAENFAEELLITPLPNGDVLTTFNFIITAQQSSDEYLFYVPWIFQEMFEKFSLGEFRISMTQGFWRANLWGFQQIDTEAPSGTELLARFADGNENGTQKWSDLVHTMNGLFCTSILGLLPQFSAQPKRMRTNPSEKDAQWWYGALGGESVCTENLKSWKKLLPCKQSGLVMLMEPTVLYSARFHSMSIKIQKDKHEQQIVWKFTFNAKTVHDTTTARQTDLIVSLFDKKLTRKCLISNVSHISISMNRQLNITGSEPAMSMSGNKLSTLDLKHDWDDNNVPVSIDYALIEDDNRQGQLKTISVHTFLKSISQIGGRICTQITNSFAHSLTAHFMQIIPWQIRLFLHTLKFTCKEDERFPFKRHFTLARDGQRPLLMELDIALPANSKCTIEVEYEAAFLKITDFSPDANSGITIPGAVLTIPLTNSDLIDILEKHNQFSTFAMDQSTSSATQIRIFGEPLLILLPVPDFSMPFNVICLVCTTIAIYYGNAFALSTKLMKLVPKEEKKEDETKVSILQRIKGNANKFLNRVGDRIGWRRCKQNSQSE